MFRKATTIAGSLAFYSTPLSSAILGAVWAYSHGFWWALGGAIVGLLSGYILLAVSLFCWLRLISFLRRNDPVVPTDSANSSSNHETA